MSDRMCTPEQRAEKVHAERNMMQFDAQPAEVRRMIAHAPYSFPMRGNADVRAIATTMARLMRDRDVAKVGPVPVVYRKRKRARR